MTATQNGIIGSRRIIFVFLSILTLIFGGVARAQEDTARQNLLAKIDSQLKYLRSIHKIELLSCNISVKFEPMQGVIKIDSQCRYLFCLIIKNHGKDTCRFPELYGRLEEEETLITLRMLKKRRGKYILVSDHQMWFEDVSGSTTRVTVNPGKEKWKCERLCALFDITSKGKYKIDGFYKTNCNKIIELNKIDGVYFEVK